MMRKEKTVHLLLRFSDSLLKNEDTITNHNNVVLRNGAVWFGKMGSTVSQVHIDKLNNQIKENVATYVYLVKGNRRKSIAYRAKLIFASKSYPKDEENLIPEYYRKLDIPRFVKFWVKIGEIVPVDHVELNKLRVVSSVFPLSETLSKSSSGHFIIHEIDSEGVVI